MKYNGWVYFFLSKFGLLIFMKLYAGIIIFGMDEGKNITIGYECFSKYRVMILYF